MRLLTIAVLSLYLPFAFAQSYSTSMTVKLVNEKGENFTQGETFHQADIEIFCEKGYMQIFTNNTTSFNRDAAMSLQRSYEDQHECIDKQSVIANTSFVYKVLVVMNKDGKMSDLRFCPMQESDADCFNKSFNLSAR